MSGNFNGQILVDKLSKLNSSQQSIETLSHWCIFHRKNAKQVVETWDRQFHCSSRDRRVAFLYLANDILQNSRRKGTEFVVEFWKVLFDALSDVVKNGDESDRRAVVRLIDIWDERKVFGSRAQVLKEDLFGRNKEEHDRNGRNSTPKRKSSYREELEKIISSYEQVYSSSVDEDTILRKCQDAVNSVDKLEKDTHGDPHLVGSLESGIMEDLQGQHAILRETIEQLKSDELSRAVLVSNLRDSLREQELKLQQVRNQLQAAHVAFEIAGSLCEQRINRNNEQSVADSRPKESSQVSEMSSNFVRDSQISNGEKEKMPVMYTPQVVIPENPPQSEDDNRKSAAAAVAARLAASTSSAQMLSFVLSSLASEGVIGQQIKDDNLSGDNKRLKLDNGVPPYTPTLPMQPPPPPPPAFPHPDSLQKLVPPQPPVAQLSAPLSSSISLQAPPLSLPPLQPPLHPNQYMQNAGPMTGVPYSYGSVPQLQQQLPMPNYQMPGMAPFPGLNNFHNGQLSESSAYSSQPPLPGTAPPTFTHP